MIPLLAGVGVGGAGVGWRLEERMRLCLRLGFLEADTELPALGRTGQASISSFLLSCH